MMPNMIAITNTIICNIPIVYTNSLMGNVSMYLTSSFIACKDDQLQIAVWGEVSSIVPNGVLLIRMVSSAT